jgi:hypothetical protein
MTASGQRKAPRHNTTFSLDSIAQVFRGRQWMIYGAYIVLAVAVLLAAFARAVGGLKPGEILLILFAGILILRRLVKRDFSFQITLVDVGFLLIIVAGTFLPLIAAILRHIYIDKTVISGLIGPVEYYLWYRVMLETLPLPSRMPMMLRLIVVVISVISFIGLLQIAGFPGIEDFLMKFFPTYETTEAPRIHRATSLVGGWETLAALAAYAILLINQIQTKAEYVVRFGTWKRWNLAFFIMLAINVVALISTLSVAGFVAVVLGFLLAWRLNGGLARSSFRLVLVAAAIGLVVLAPNLVQRIAYQKHPAPTTTIVSTTTTTTVTYPTQTHLADKFKKLPTTWASRALHWYIVVKTVSANKLDILVGVQPSFAYPVLSFGSTESLYLLLLYRGGIIYLLAFLAFIIIIGRTVWQQRQNAHGFNRMMLSGIFLVLIVNFVIDIWDAHFFSAGEWEVLVTLIALAVGTGLQTEQSMGMAALTPRDAPTSSATTGDTPTVLRAVAVAAPGKWDGQVRLALVGVLALSALAGGYGLLKQRHLPAPPAVLAPSYYDGTAPISLENQDLGSSAWQLTPGVNTTFIQGYADKSSVLPGESLQLFVSTMQASSYDLYVYRMGWYMGLGGKLYAQQHITTSQTQGYWTADGGLQCASCSVNISTHLVEAHWNPSYTLNVQRDWPTGVYLVKLVAPKGQSYIPFVVRNDTSGSELLVSVPVMAYEADNSWGGYSLYGQVTSSATNSPDIAETGDPNRATAVSFDRPNSRGAGAGDLLNWDLHTIRWLERSGYDVSYTTNVDVSEHPELIPQHTVFVSLGHDAYWTQNIRNGLEHARDVGVNLAFLGAQAGYWQARLTMDSAGSADRTLVCFKVGTNASDPTDPGFTWNSSMNPVLDPAYNDPTTRNLTTARWRDPILGRPENTLLGLMYAGTLFHTTTQYTYQPDWVVRAGNLNSIVGAAQANAISGGVLGYAFDAIAPNDQTPLNLSLVSQSPVLDATGVLRTANTAYYALPLGNIVFDAGSIWWAWGLDEFSFVGADQPNVLLGNQGVSSVTTQIINAMLAAAHVPTPAGQATQ